MPLQKSVGDAVFILLASREIPVGSKRSAERRQSSGSLVMWVKINRGN